ncbi:MAG TPA: hypothetical protein VF824_20220 [Thermoanaerobaculia bacterium]
MWIDSDHDGTSAAGELLPIARSTVRALDTTYSVVNRRDSAGNLYRLMSHLQGAAPHREIYYDVYFRVAR